MFREQAIPRQVVVWNHPEFKKGTVVVSTKERRLYYVLGDEEAIRALRLGAQPAPEQLQLPGLAKTRPGVVTERRVRSA